ncbi:hypothetical protein DV702_14960 [Sporosarcina sp. PTS2304]|nr:hypothetical protein DV702_14960 [Sporosarcina sp. PTS2304]
MSHVDEKLAIAMQYTAKKQLLRDDFDAGQKRSVCFRILPRETGRFPEGTRRTRQKCVGDYACKCKDVLLFAALHSQKPYFATAFPDPPGVAGSSGRILEVVSGSQFVFVQK